MPAPNPFIPTDLSLKTEEAQAYTAAGVVGPKLIEHQPGVLSLWHRCAAVSMISQCASGSGSVVGAKLIEHQLGVLSLHSKEVKQGRALICTFTCPVLSTYAGVFSLPNTKSPGHGFLRRCDLTFPTPKALVMVDLQSPEAYASPEAAVCARCVYCPSTARASAHSN